MVQITPTGPPFISLARPSPPIAKRCAASLQHLCLFALSDPRIQELTDDGLNLAGVKRVLELENELAELRAEIEQVKAELHQSMVEVGTEVCRTPAEARAELVRLRREIMRLIVSRQMLSGRA